MSTRPSPASRGNEPFNSQSDPLRADGHRCCRFHLRLLRTHVTHQLPHTWRDEGAADRGEYREAAGIIKIRLPGGLQVPTEKIGGVDYNAEDHRRDYSHEDGARAIIH